MKSTREKYEEAFSEVYEILKLLTPEERAKISKSFIEMIKTNKSEKYDYKIDKSKSLAEQEMQRETKIILSLIYRSYLCDEETRKKLEEQDKEALKKLEEERKEKYNTDNLFKNSKTSSLKNEDIKEENANKEMVVKKESFLKRILDKIKNLFK